MRYQLTTVNNEQGVTVQVGGELNIYGVSELYKDFNEFLENSDEVTVDLSQVTVIDTAGIQLLIYFKKYTPPSKKFILKAHSKPVLKIIDLYGLVNLLGDSIAIKSSWKSEFSFKYGMKKHPEKV